MRGILIGNMTALGALGLVVWGCSSAGSTASPSTIRLELTGDGQQVSLKGSPVDSTYKANYPVAGVSRMVVNILGTGDINAACQSGGSYGDCADQPFFTEVIRNGTSSHVMVFDL